MDSAALTAAGLFFVAALLYSSVGHAGASAYLAAMAFLGFASETMRPTALVLNVVVASIVTTQFVRAGHFSWRTLWPFALASVPLSFVGGALTLPSAIYKQAVGAVLAIAAVRLASMALRTQPTTRATVNEPPIGAAIVWGSVIGLASGLTGTGGGIFLTPLLLFAGWADVRTAAGVSAAFILVNSIAGLLPKLDSLHALRPATPLWVAAAAIGGVVGSSLGSGRVPPRALRLLLALVLAIAAGKLILT